MKPSTSVILLAIAACAATTISCDSGKTGQVQARAQTATRAPARAARPVLGPPIYHLDDQTMLRWPLPATASQYGRIDGFKLKPYVDKLIGVSEQSRRDGNQWWGRITGTPYFDQAQNWVEQQFRRIGLQTRRQAFDLPPVWYPDAWEITASSGDHQTSLKTAQPVLRSVGTPPAGIDAEAVYVGLGSPTEMRNVDLKGKAVFVYSIPQPSALRHSASVNGALKRLESSGAAAVVMILGLPGNVRTQLWGTGGEGQTLTTVPTFSLGLEDGMAVRHMLDAGEQVKIHISLRTETRSGLKPSVVWGVLPGQTDENILIMAHADAFFQGGVDNASGVAVMLGLADYFAGIPRAERRRTITFLAPIGHHVSRDVSLLWIHNNMKDFWAKTALIINAEHVTTTQVYRFDRLLVRSNALTAHRFYVGGNKVLHDILFHDFSLFGMGLYEAPQIRPTGDLSRLKDLAPGIEVIESNQFYHSDIDVNAVPAPGLEGIARAYAKIIDDVNKVDLKDLRAVTAPSKSQE